jgi:hypothetical protein
MSKLIQKYASLKEAADLAIQANDFNALAGDILTNVALQTINTYQQKLNVGIEDSVSDLIQTFKQKVSEAIFDISRGWKIINREAHLFPRGCRFCHKKADSTVVIIEQDPQIRSLLFTQGMLGRQADGHSDVQERIPLALPFVVFFLHFKEDMFCNLYCGWRTSPLRSLQDRMFAPLLPNIRDEMSVCVGYDLRVTGTGIVEKSDSILSHFWNSQFNKDLSNRWWLKDQIDERLKTGREWSRASLENPTFILNLNYNYTKSAEDILNLLTMHEIEPDETSLRHKLSETIDSSVASLFSKIMRYFKKTKFDKHHPKEITDMLIKIIKNANGEFQDLVFSIQHEIEVLAADIEAGRQKKVVEARGPLWADYSP